MTTTAIKKSLRFIWGIFYDENKKSTVGNSALHNTDDGQKLIIVIIVIVLLILVSA